MDFGVFPWLPFEAAKKGTLKDTPIAMALHTRHSQGLGCFLEHKHVGKPRAQRAIIMFLMPSHMFVLTEGKPGQCSLEVRMLSKHPFLTIILGNGLNWGWRFLLFLFVDAYPSLSEKIRRTPPCDPHVNFGASCLDVRTLTCWQLMDFQLNHNKLNF